MVDVVDKSSITEDEEKRASYSVIGRLRGVTAILIILAILVPPALIRSSAQGNLSFDSRLLADLNATAPDYVFIGNSMLQTRIDERVLASYLGERCCVLLWAAGAESAWAYEALKNFALATQHRPKKVIIFFRDTYLTQPTYRATDRYWWRIERMSHGEEPELTRAMSASRSWQEQLEYRLGELYPVQRMREHASAVVSWFASEVVTPGRVPYAQPAGQKYDALFDLENLRGSDADDTAFQEEDLSEFDFNAHVGSSLLPAMLRAAKQAGVGLVFVRVQRRPTRLGPPPQRRELEEYTRHFRDFVAAKGAAFYDFTGDPELTLDHYLDGDHIRPEWKPQSTEHFLRHLAAVFR